MPPMRRMGTRLDGRRLTTVDAGQRCDRRRSKGRVHGQLNLPRPIFPILPREIFGRFVNESFWMDPKNNVSQVPIV